MEGSSKRGGGSKKRGGGSGTKKIRPKVRANLGERHALGCKTNPTKSHPFKPNNIHPFKPNNIHPFNRKRTITNRSFHRFNLTNFNRKRIKPNPTLSTHY
ncbi:hypothetical protein HanHA89_Chr08g0296641 [Helianthus annuus]|nr:hypothetical protein HanHA89_Chr08g0296641 [Helianthus annuus]